MINALDIYKHSHLHLHSFEEYALGQCLRAAHLSTSSATAQIKLQEAENDDQTEERKVTHHSHQG